MFCRIHKFVISNALDANKPLWSVTQRHVARCAPCSNFHAVCRTMGNRLTADSRCIDDLVSESLSERILDEVAVAKTVPIPASINWRPILAAAACILVIAVPSVVFLLRGPAHTPTDYEIAVAAARDLYKSGALLAGGLVDEGSNLPLVAANPFENEIRNLTADTESALRFVIANVGVTPSMAQLPN